QDLGQRRFHARAGTGCQDDHGNGGFHGRPMPCRGSPCKVDVLRDMLMHANADNLISSRFDTIIYDLDGTLVDMARDMCIAISRVLAAHGLPAITDDDARLFMGEGSKMTMRRAFAKNGRTLDDAEASAVTREFVRYYEQDPIRYTTAFDGVADVVA